MKRVDTKSMIDQILEVADQMQPTDAPAFFYTRLRARMENEMAPAREQVWYKKPAWAIAAMTIFITLNIWMLTQAYQQKSDSKTASPGIDNFINSYQLSSSSDNFYYNQ